MVSPGYLQHLSAINVVIVLRILSSAGCSYIRAPGSFKSRWNAVDTRTDRSPSFQLAGQSFSRVDPGRSSMKLFKYSFSIFVSTTSDELVDGLRLNYNFFMLLSIVSDEHTASPLEFCPTTEYSPSLSISAFCVDQNVVANLWRTLQSDTLPLSLLYSDRIPI